MFYIRVDANKEVATGHIMRCLSIADEFLNRGINTTFITADRYSYEMITSRGYEIICLNTIWNNLDEEIDKLKELIKSLKIEKILIDSYFVTKKYLCELSKVTNIIYIDDLGYVDYPVSTIVNYNIYGDSIDYHSQLASEKVELLIGPEFVPLRKEFQSITPAFRENVKSVIVSTGGTDNLNLSGKLMEAIVSNERYSDIEFHVISGKMNSNIDNLLKISESHNNIYIHQNAKNMSEIMCKCDIAITAGGSTMYELCACGIPMITFSFADNQLKGVKSFADKELAIYCGDARDGVEKLILCIKEELNNLINDSKKREDIFVKVTKLVDGLGVKRLADRILYPKVVM